MPPESPAKVLAGQNYFDQFLHKQCGISSGGLTMIGSSMDLCAVFVMALVLTHMV